MATKKFPSELDDRGTVLVTDKLLIHNITTGNTEYTTVAGLLTSLSTFAAGQIGFPSTQVPSVDPNTLDDYEEGTWTMGVSFDGLTVGITYSQNTGYYTKIGNIVTISGHMIFTSKGSSSGAAVITGLPFTVVNNDAGRAAATLYLVNISFANQFQGVPLGNTKTVLLKEVTEAGVNTNIENTDFADDSEIIINCTYRVE